MCCGFVSHALFRFAVLLCVLSSSIWFSFENWIEFSHDRQKPIHLFTVCTVLLCFLHKKTVFFSMFSLKWWRFTFIAFFSWKRAFSMARWCSWDAFFGLRASNQSNSIHKMELIIFIHICIVHLLALSVVNSHNYQFGAFFLWIVIYCLRQALWICRFNKQTKKKNFSFLNSYSLQFRTCVIRIHDLVWDWTSATFLSNSYLLTIMIHACSQYQIRFPI